ncbi:hypothetical protein LTR66_014730 [Elasticomyces elasticus]|nr:hypothetical protein LTR66_014730 [Elasticomyces elasticus]
MMNTSTEFVKLRTTLTSRPAMKSVRFHGRGDVRVDEVEEPVCGKGQVKMRPAYAGICGTDLHEYTGGPVLIPARPHHITGSTYPVSMGHEFAGIVEETGEGVVNVFPGQRAVVRPTIFDGTCTACKQGYNHCCENIGFIGLSGYGGGMSKRIVAPAGHFYPIPDSISLEAAALIEPLAVAWHAVNISPFKTGDSVLVVGGGPIGLGVVQKTRELTDGIGADVIFDAAGVEEAIVGAIPACRTQGTIVNIAVWEKSPTLPVNQLMYNEVRYMGAALFDESSFVDTIRAMSYGQLKSEAMITSRISLDKVVDKGFKALLEHRDQHCKILVDVQS